MVVLQLDLFKTEEECEMDSLRQSVEAIRVSGDKVRRGTYAKLNELNKECVDLKSRLEIIERNLCHENYQ
jgi:hypothetical protein